MSDTIPVSWPVDGGRARKLTPKLSGTPSNGVICGDGGVRWPKDAWAASTVTSWIGSSYVPGKPGSQGTVIRAVMKSIPLRLIKHTHTPKKLDPRPLRTGEHQKQTKQKKNPTTISQSRRDQKGFLCLTRLLKSSLSVYRTHKLLFNSLSLTLSVSVEMRCARRCACQARRESSHDFQHQFKSESRDSSKQTNKNKVPMVG